MHTAPRRARAAAAAALAVAAFLVLVPLARGEIRYTVQRLLPLDRTGGTEVEAVNDAGASAGNARDARETAVRWDPAGQPAALDQTGTAANYPKSRWGWAINNGGTIVGDVLLDPVLQQGWHAARWAPGSTTPVVLDALSGGFSRAYGVNDAGTAVGYADQNDPDGGTRAVRWDAGGTALTRLGSAGTDFRAAYARGINNAGVAVGFSDKVAPFSPLGSRAIRWTPDGTAHVLGDLGANTEGRTNSDARAINAAGTIVGMSEGWQGDNSLGRFAAIWDAGSDTPRILNNGAVANDINDAGFAVGDGGDGHAVIWDPDGAATVLDALVDPAGNYRFESATGISNTGYIVANFKSFSYLLTPVPEPASASILAAGALMLLRRRRRGS